MIRKIITCHDDLEALDGTWYVEESGETLDADDLRFFYDGQRLTLTQEQNDA